MNELQMWEDFVKAQLNGGEGHKLSSSLDLLPGTRALHGGMSCVVKGTLEYNSGSQEVVLYYDHPRLVPSINQFSHWGIAPKSEVKRWAPKRPGM